MPGWSERFFEGLWQEVQLGQGTAAEKTAASKLIWRTLQLEPHSRVLDVACGDGRISLELAASGQLMTGVDTSERFLDEARRESQNRGLYIQWKSCDMRDLPFDAEFDAAFNFGGSFGYFDEDGDSRTAASVWRALRPGGRFALDVATAETILPRFREHYLRIAGEILVLSRNQYDYATGRIETEWILVAGDGHREEAHSSIRLYTCRELATLLVDVGFAHVEVLDPDGPKPFGIGATRALVIVTKSK